MIIRGQRIEGQCDHCIYLGGKLLPSVGIFVNFVICHNHPEHVEPYILDDEKGLIKDGIGLSRVLAWSQELEQDPYWNDFRKAYGEMYQIAQERGLL